MLKSNYLRLVLGMALKFFSSVVKELKLKVRKFCGLIPTFREVTRGKLVGGRFALATLNRVKLQTKMFFSERPLEI